MLQETTNAAAATGGNAATALTQMGVGHLFNAMLSDPGSYAVQWAVLLTLLEPVMILVMGGVVLVIVMAILLPIMEINQLVH